MFKNIIIAAGLLFMLGLGVWGTRYYYTWQEKIVQEESQVLLEKIKTVAKLVTVEGYFSEVYDYKDYYSYDLSPFRKKALMRVKAKVSVGYDLERIEMESFPEQKLLLMKNLPEPQIISIDHEIDYYDITEGTFNSFTESDYNKLNKKAKAFIEEKAKDSELLRSAETQGNQILDLVKFMAENAGWTVKFEKRKVSVKN